MKIGSRFAGLAMITTKSTEYASHEDRFSLRRSSNDNHEERMFRRNTDVAKWTSDPAFLALAA
jgi:hypothetical protein